MEEFSKEYTDKNGEVYVQKPDLDTECTGCAFNRYYEKDSCTYSQAVVNCASASIIWVKKEQKMSAEVTKDFIESKYMPKAGIKYDQEKPRYSLLPPTALEEVVNVLTFGSKKYEDFNWMHLENPNDRFFSAASRHMWAWQKGEKRDSENGYNHLAAAVSNLLFILELELLNNKVPTKD